MSAEHLHYDYSFQEHFARCEVTTKRSFGFVPKKRKPSSRLLSFCPVPSNALSWDILIIRLPNLYPFLPSPLRWALLEDRLQCPAAHVTVG